MNVLSLNIIPSPISNDHQVRLLIDNEDWLGDEFLGVDPTDFFDQKSFVEGLLLVGRCDCGVLGCENVLIDVTSTNDTVHWKVRSGQERADLEFALDAYSEMLERARNDFSWEDANRRTERVIGNMLIHHKIDHVYEF